MSSVCAPVTRATIRALTGLALGSLLASSSLAASPRGALVALTTDARELLRLGASVPVNDDAPVQILLEERRWFFDDSGLATAGHRCVYRIDAADRPLDWNETSVHWAPSRQARPQLDAQVVLPSGESHRLDPATISESASPVDDFSTFADERVLRAPLPAMTRGAIVEEISLLRDVADPIGAGRLVHDDWTRTAPVATRLLVVDLPQDSPFRHRIEKLDGVEVARETADGRLRVTFRATRVPPVRDLAIWGPADGERFPAIVFSTGTSWERVAARYREIAQARIAGDPGHAAVREFALGAAGADREALGPRQVLERVVRRLHRDIRFTGVEFGEAGIVPSPPSETLKRRYGDCKDKSLLLVAALRELGIPADLALLRTAPARDVAADLPGWGGFDHAVVRLAAPHDVWIDATLEFARVGEMPPTAWGRLALPITAEPRGLERTPAATAEENRYVELREVYLATNGPGRVVETSEYGGSKESEAREMYGQMPPAKLNESLEPYARAIYRASGRVRARTSDPHDFGQPFRLVLEVEQAECALTDLSVAATAMSRDAVFDQVPTLLKSFDPDSLADPGYTGHLRNDFVILEPCAREHRYRLVPPRGYFADSLPEPLDLALGSIRYRETFEADSTGVVTARLSLVPASARLTPAEVKAFRIAVADLDARPDPLVVFRHRGLALAAEGRLPEAFRWLEADVERSPKDPEPHMRLATALLSAALGAAARSEARRAVELAPGRAEAHELLGNVLCRDLVGRPFEAGWDPAGSAAAFRRATALDTGLVSAKLSLAVLLEHDARGLRYGAGANLGGAIELYRSIGKDELAENGFAANLAVALSRAGRFAELEEWARAAGDESFALPHRLLAVAAQRGAAAAVAEAQRSNVEADERSAALVAASRGLIELRRYGDAAALLRAGSRGQANAASVLAQAEFLESLRPCDSSRESAHDPRTIGYRWAHVMIADGGHSDSLRLLLPARLHQAHDEGAGAPAQRASHRQYARVLRQSGLPSQALLDLLCSQMTFEVEGDSVAGYRVTLRFPGGQTPRVLYTKRESGRWVFVDGSGANSPTGIATEARLALEAGDSVAAGRWLELARQEIPRLSADSAIAGAFHVFFPPGGRTEVLRMQLAAASILATGDSAEAVQALGPLGPAVESALPPEAAEAARWVRAQALATAGRPEVALALVESLGVRHPGSALLPGIAWDAYSRKRDLAGMQQYFDRRLARSPADPVAWRGLMDLGRLRADTALVARAGGALEAAGRITGRELNNWAWVDVTAGVVGEKTLERVNRAVLEENATNANSLHTQAAVYACRGRIAEARDVLVQYMAVEALDEPDRASWYVVGLIAEQLGLAAHARDAYRRVTPEVLHFGVRDLMSQSAERRRLALEGGRRRASASPSASR